MKERQEKRRIKRRKNKKKRRKEKKPRSEDLLRALAAYVPTRADRVV